MNAKERIEEVKNIDGYYIQCFFYKKEKYVLYLMIIIRYIYLTI